MREVYDDWFADHTGTHLCSPRGGIPDALNGLPHNASQPGDLRRSSVFRTRLELDALTVVPTAPAGGRFSASHRCLAFVSCTCGECLRTSTCGLRLASPLRVAVAFWRGVT